MLTWATYVKGRTKISINKFKELMGLKFRREWLSKLPAKIQRTIRSKAKVAFYDNLIILQDVLTKLNEKRYSYIYIYRCKLGYAWPRHVTIATCQAWPPPNPWTMLGQGFLGRVQARPVARIRKWPRHAGWHSMGQVGQPL